jgi:3-deoxy-D-manno-octulosonic-acid transferase
VSLFLYNIFLFFYRAAIQCYSLFNDKAKKWIAGRQKWRQTIASALLPGEKRIWIHCSSLGEFEQGRPLIESWKEKYPQYKIVLSFFSPSGYEVRKDYAMADYVFYLPMDGKKNARQFIALINPSLAVFVKYEFWFYYLDELKKNAIPTILVSGAFRPGQAFFKWYGSFFRKLLGCFSWIFVQDDQSKTLLKGIGFNGNALVSGDTRYDRVIAIAAARKSIPIAERFKGKSKIIIAGSTWPDDEKILKACIANMPADWKMIIAPHEIDDARIRSVQMLFDHDVVLYSALQKQEDRFGKKVLIIDNIGLLSSLFAYGDIAYIGGGFQKGGIHNILEPAAFGLPVIFGPVYKKFVEASKLVSLQFAFAVNSEENGKIILSRLIADAAYRNTIHDSLIKYMQENTGATEAVLGLVDRQRWL